MDEFVVRTKEDVLPGIKRLKAGESVTVVPSMRALFEYEARRANLVLIIEDDGFCYEFRVRG